jgi:AraC-like DNA-binding protein
MPPWAFAETIHGAVHTVPAKSVNNVLAAASSRVSAERLCHEIGLQPARLSDPHARVPMAKLVEAFERAARLTADSSFGMHVGARTDLRAFGLMSYIIVNCSTLGEALENVARYFPVWTDGAVFRFIKDGSTAHLTWEYADPSVAECRHDCEMTLACVAKISHFLDSDGPRHREVQFQHRAPRDAFEHRRVFLSEVSFSRPCNQLVFDKSVLSLPLRGAAPELRELLAQLGDSLLAAVSSHTTLVDQARSALRQGLMRKDIQLESVSRALGLGSRTLQRRLKEHGVTYNGLLSGMRRHLAELYVRESELPIGEISERLAFAHPAEFHRAFREWTGTTPRRFRQTSTA